MLDTQVLRWQTGPTVESVRWGDAGGGLLAQILSGGGLMADVKIEIRANGPYRVTGPMELVDTDGKAYSIPEGQWVSLCRCGNSANKPFCDSAHRESGFEAASEAH